MLSCFCSLIMKCVQEHRNTFDKNNLRDLVDIYINAQKDRGFDDCELASKTFKIKSNSIFISLQYYVLYINNTAFLDYGVSFLSDVYIGKNVMGLDTKKIL